MPDHPPPDLSLVVPAFREELRLPRTLEELGRYVQTSAARTEVIVVVEQSPDGTLALAQDFAARHLGFTVIDSTPQRGKGFAVRTGMQRARGEIVLFMDADLSVPMAEVDVFRACMAARPEIAVLIGDRQHAASDIRRRQAFHRERMGQIFNLLLRGLAGMRWRDTQCGFKAFRREAAREIFARQRIDGFAFDVEVLMLAEALGLRVESHPVTWINSPESKVRLVADSLRMMRDAWRVRRLVQSTMAEYKKSARP